MKFLIYIITTLIIVPVYAQDIDDGQVAEAVETQLQVKKDIPAHLVDVEVEEGIVKLSGSTEHLLAREMAETSALSVRGVLGVVNLLEVKVPNLADDTLRNRILKAFEWDPAVEVNEVTPTVRDGHVILSGNVDSYQEKMLVEDVTASVRGVRKITNYLEFVKDNQLPDMEIREEITEILDYDGLIDGSLIDVMVEDASVRLRGVVSSAYEKERAIRLANMPGVDTVLANDLTINYDEAQQSEAKQRTDQEIRQSVQKALAYDPRVEAENIEVSVDTAMVTLKGNVQDLQARYAAQRTAQNIKGVDAIRNQIEVKPEDVPADGALAARARSKVIWDPFLEKHEINVEALDGTLFISGAVDTYYEKLRAENVLSRIEGVVSVENDLLAQDYEGGASWKSEGTPIPVARDKSDLEIEEDIENELWWSPFVNEEDINTNVDKGVAYLTGKVDSYREKKLAAINAYEGGAIFVDNQLEVSTELEVMD